MFQVGSKRIRGRSPNCRRQRSRRRGLGRLFGNSVFILPRVRNIRNSKNLVDTSADLTENVRLGEQTTRKRKRYFTLRLLSNSHLVRGLTTVFTRNKIYRPPLIRA